MLSDREIWRSILVDRKIVIVPFSESDIQPVSYDVHVGTSARLFEQPTYRPLDLSVESPAMTEIEIPEYDGDVFSIKPLQFMLVSLDEYLELPDDIESELHGKSTIGRAGLLVHATAGLIDPGYSGRITCELFNLSPRPIRLWHGMPIGQFVFHRLSSSARRPYGSQGLNSHYQGHMRAEGSRHF